VYDKNDIFSDFFLIIWPFLAKKSFGMRVDGLAKKRIVSRVRGKIVKMV